MTWSRRPFLRHMNWCLRHIGRILGIIRKWRNKHTQSLLGEKETLLDRWCASKEVAKDFEKLWQLILVEEFKACVPTSIKTYIDEQKATTVYQAAVLVDDYLLTYHSAFVPTDSGGSVSNKDDKPTTLPNVVW